MDMMIKNLKFAELNTKIASVVLNTQTLHQKSFDENFKKIS